MNFLGLTIISTNHYDGKVKNSKHWRVLFEQKEKYCDKLVYDFKQKEKKLKEDLEETKRLLSIESGQLRQKNNLVEEKDEKIELLNARIRAQEENLTAISTQSYADLEDRDKKIGEQKKEIDDLLATIQGDQVEYQRVYKCLNQQVNYRNYKIEGLQKTLFDLRGEIDGKARVQEVLAEKLKLAELVARLKADLHDLKGRLSTAKKYIKIKKLAPVGVLEQIENGRS